MQARKCAGMPFALGHTSAATHALTRALACAAGPRICHVALAAPSDRPHPARHGRRASSGVLYVSGSWESGRVPRRRTQRAPHRHSQALGGLGMGVIDKHRRKILRKNRRGNLPIQFVVLAVGGCVLLAAQPHISGATAYLDAQSALGSAFDHAVAPGARTLLSDDELNEFGEGRVLSESAPSLPCIDPDAGLSCLDKALLGANSTGFPDLPFDDDEDMASICLQARALPRHPPIPTHIYAHPLAPPLCAPVHLLSRHADPGAASPHRCSSSSTRSWGSPSSATSTSRRRSRRSQTR